VYTDSLRVEVRDAQPEGLVFVFLTVSQSIVLYDLCVGLNSRSDIPLTRFKISPISV
jgi:hypothetical protein